MRRLLAFAAAASLAACATVPPTRSAALARVDAAFDRLRPIVEAALPLLPAERQHQVHAALAAVGTGIDVARAAQTLADRNTAIADAQERLAALEDELAR